MDNNSIYSDNGLNEQNESTKKTWWKLNAKKIIPFFVLVLCVLYYLITGSYKKCNLNGIYYAQNPTGHGETSYMFYNEDGTMQVYSICYGDDSNTNSYCLKSSYEYNSYYCNHIIFNLYYDPLNKRFVRSRNSSKAYDLVYEYSYQLDKIGVDFSEFRPIDRSIINSSYEASDDLEINDQCIDIDGVIFYKINGIQTEDDYMAIDLLDNYYNIFA